MTLTIEKKVGQLMVVGFEGKQVPKEFTKLIETYYISGVILFGRNIGSPVELLKLTTQLQKIAKQVGYEQPLLICLDQENGMVRRLGEGTTIFPGSMVLGATQRSQNAFEIGHATGEELKALGINWNLAPVLDVNNNPLNPVIGVRSFGESPDSVGEFGSQMMLGMQKSGLMTTLKHFPGHGDTSVDSHLDLPVISHSMERLKKIELKPFEYCIAHGADIVMTAHVSFPAIEDKPNWPATLSKKVITGLLREQLHFEGVVTTDCMEMNAIANGVGTENGAVEAIKAGADLVMISHTLEKQVAAIQKIVTAVWQGEIPEERIDQSLERLHKLRKKYLNWNESPEKQVVVPDIVGSKHHNEVAEKVYREGITIVKDEKKLIPLDKDHLSVLAIYPKNGKTGMVEDKQDTEMTLGRIVQQIDENAECIAISHHPTEEEINHIQKKAASFDRVIVGTVNVTKNDWQQDLVSKLIDVNVNIISIGLREPYDLAYYPTVSTYLCTFEFTMPALEMAVKAIYGMEEVGGCLPIILSH